MFEYQEQRGTGGRKKKTYKFNSRESFAVLLHGEQNVGFTNVTLDCEIL